MKEIKDYCLERKNKIDPNHFLNSNESKGWVVGKNKIPMVDWKACIRTWEQYEKNFETNNQDNQYSKCKGKNYLPNEDDYNHHSNFDFGAENERNNDEK